MERIAILSLLVFLTSCVDDLGMLPGVCGPIVLPVEIVNAGTSDFAIDDAIEEWNSRSPIRLFVRVEAPSGAFGWATVTEGVPTVRGREVGGLAAISWAHGEILTCEITISSALAYDPYWHVALIEHELGHCLGLEDDPPSIDLGSIMSDPFNWGSSPTESDISLVLAHDCP